MKINSKILCIPPYISTPWNNVSALRMNGAYLVVNLIDGNSIEIPGLPATVIEEIFNHHVAFIEHQIQEKQHFSNSAMPKNDLFPLEGQQVAIPFRVSLNALDELGNVLQHNPLQADSPEIPQEILEKIIAITKIIAPEAKLMMTKAEPHCNCVHCQIAKSVNPNAEIAHEETTPCKEETVPDQELQFQQWEITQSGSELFSVTNKLDTQEKYSVYLGEPVGCTCGKPGCEHIIAVLRS